MERKAQYQKNVGLNIDRFVEEEGISFVRSVNTYGKIYHRVCILPSYVMLVLGKSHMDELGHGGFKKGVEKLRQWCWWKSCNEDMKHFCKACKICKLYKSYNQIKAPVLEHPETSYV